MIAEKTLVTKLKGTGKPEVQGVLKGLQKQTDKITAVRLVDNRLSIRTDRTNKYLEVGRMKLSNLSFIDSLHNFKIETKVTGGTYLLTDIVTGLPIREVGSLNDLTPTEQILLMDGVYTYVQKLRGMNVLIHAVEA